MWFKNTRDKLIADEIEAFSILSSYENVGQNIF